MLRIVCYELQISNALGDAIVEGPLVFFDPEGKPGDLVGLIRAEIMSKVDLNKALIDLLADKKDAKKMVLAVDLVTGIYQQWYLVDSRKQKHRITWFRIHLEVERFEKESAFQYRSYADANIAFASLDDDKTDIVDFVQSRSGTVTAAADSLDRAHEPEDTVFTEYRFLNGELLQRSTKNLE